MPLRPKKILGELPVGAESHIPINVSVCVRAITTGLLLHWDITARRSQRFYFPFSVLKHFRLCHYVVRAFVNDRLKKKKGLFLKISALKKTAGIIC